MASKASSQAEPIDAADEAQGVQRTETMNPGARGFLAT